MRALILSAGLTLSLLGPALADPAAQLPAGGEAGVKSTQGGAVTLTSWTIDAGGSTSATGGSFRLGATIGQPDAALVSGGSFRLSAGFWRPQSSSGGDGLFANGFE